MSVFDVLKYPVGPERVTFAQADNLPESVRKDLLGYRNVLFDLYSKALISGKISWDDMTRIINEKEVKYTIKLLREL